MFSLRTIVAAFAAAQLASAHLVVTYPGWRGDNLATNGTYNLDDYKPDHFPYGMQWAYPCGGMKMSENRTYWPITGGAINFQPGWFQGHQIGLLYINMGLPDYYSHELGYKIPQNYSHNVIKPFQFTGPTNDAWPGLNICLPQVPMVPGIDYEEGMNITIQIVEAAQHGAALYNCIDVTLTSNMSKVEPVTEKNCYNDTKSISFQQQYYTAQLDATSAAPIIAAWSSTALVSFALAAFMML